MAQLIGNPVYSEIVTGQATVTASAAAVGSAAGLRLLWIKAFSANAGAVYYGGAGVTTGTGMPLVAGERVLIALDSLTKLFIVGTASDVVAWEAYR